MDTFGTIFAVLAVISLYGALIWGTVSTAGAKGYHRGGFLIFAVFIPVIALIVALVLKPVDDDWETDRVECPSCAELIKPNANLCRYCHTQLN